MRLLFNGQPVDARASVELMHIFAQLRAQHFSDLLVEADNASSIWLFKSGDRAMVRYAPSRNGDSYLAQSTDEEETSIEFKQSDGRVDDVPKNLTVPLRLGLLAIIHFVRCGGMTAALQWHEAA